jgi:hypothetical protein
MGRFRSLEALYGEIAARQSENGHEGPSVGAVRKVR